MNSQAALILCLISCFSLTVSGFWPSSSRGRVTCDDPQIPNSDHTPKAWFTWTHETFTVLTFKCSDGFELQGSKTARCMLDGEWTKLPSCVPTPGGALLRIQCDLPAIGDGVDVNPMKASYRLHESVTFACPGVRKYDNMASTSCGMDGQFHPDPPKCIQPRCVPPEIPKNGGLNPNQPSYAVGDVVQFKCGDGYALMGNATTTCGKDGYFPYTETSCVALQQQKALATCDKPEKGRKLNILGQEKEQYIEGDRVEFYCASGYRLRGDAILRCLSSGEWSGRIPTCRRVFCIRPRNPSNGYSTASKLYYSLGQSVKFSCNAGYTLYGSSFSTCGMDGYFRPRAPRCESSSNIYQFSPRY